MERETDMTFLKEALAAYDRHFPTGQPRTLNTDEAIDADPVVKYLRAALNPRELTTANGWRRSLVVEQLRTDANLFLQIADAIEGEVVAYAYLDWKAKQPERMRRKGRVAERRRGACRSV
jgi:hypothetical protein